MRIPLLAAVAIVGIVLTGNVAAVAQSDELPVQHKKVFGYQDPETGVFKALNRGESNAVDFATIAPTTGTIDVNVTITLKTALPTGGSIACVADFIALSENALTASILSYNEEAAVKATVSGSTATCKVAIPYSWLIPPASTTVLNSLSGSLTVTMGVPGTTTATVPILTRSNSQNILTGGKIPATGATTTYAVAVTL